MRYPPIIFDGLGSEVRNTALLAAVTSAILLVMFALWFDVPFSWLLGYAAIGMLATVSVPVLYRLGGFTRADEIEWLEQRESAEHDAMQVELARLRQELGALAIDEGVQQCAALTAILDDYHAVIDARFRGQPKSPLAYLSSARQVQKQAMQNLNDMVATGHSLASISRQGGVAPDPDRLQSLRAEQSGRLDALVAANRELFDALTDTAVEVANIREFSDYDRLDTLARLQSLAEIARHRGR